MYSAIADRSSEFKEIYVQYLGEPGCPSTSYANGYDGTYDWDRQLETLPVKDKIRLLVESGENVGKRSEVIMSVVNALVRAGIKRADIFHIFENYPIGEKWRRQHRSKVKWLDKHIDKVHSKNAPAKKSTDQNHQAEKPRRDYPLTDTGAAERFADEHREYVRYCPQQRLWLVNQGAIWKPDESGQYIYQCGKTTARQLYAQASTISDDVLRKSLVKYALSLESKTKMESMLFLAGKEPGMSISLSELDADDWLFNCQNGTINLRTGDVYKHRASDFITRYAPVDINPKATCPTWYNFLNRTTNGNDNLIQFLKRVVGYCLTGDTREQCLFFLYGIGANGKSTFLEAVRSMLGDYSKQADFSTFLVRQNDGIRNDLAALKGSRFVCGIEVDSGKKLAEALVKQITGQDTITARFLHREFFEFKPTFKLFLAANHKPTIKGTDYAIWRRIRLIPFTVTIPEKERDQDLPNKLRRELPGILNWAIEGCYEWQQNGLGIPDEVRAATEEYREEMDILGGFLSDHCILEPELMVKSKDLFEKYEEWCRANDEEPIKKRTFGLKLKERGLKDHRIGVRQDRGWLGIGLQTQPPDRHNQTQVSVFSIRENNLSEKSLELRLNASGEFNASGNEIGEVVCSACANFTPNPINPSLEGHCIGIPPDEDPARYPYLKVDCPEFREREVACAQ